MPAITSTAPGKIIIFGEHAVVYGRPAIAVPVNQVRARAAIMAEPKKPTGEVFIDAPDINLNTSLAELPEDHPIKQTISGVKATLGISSLPACTVRITSTIPVSAGMGSGAAVSAALIRALSGFLGHTLPDEKVSELVFEVEKIYHGTPSGIDNSVITYAQPVYYVRGEPIETLLIKQPITLVVGDTGTSSPTADTVGDVRRAWDSDRNRYEAYFDRIADISKNARIIIESGDPEGLGPLMDLNHELLKEIGVSSPELDYLVETARKAGALGAKLSGGGRGGNMIALVPEETTSFVSNALKDGGAEKVFTTRIRNTDT
jgi:mevalonate kinase